MPLRIAIEDGGEKMGAKNNGTPRWRLSDCSQLSAGRLLFVDRLPLRH